MSLRPALEGAAPTRAAWRLDAAAGRCFVRPNATEARMVRTLLVRLAQLLIPRGHPVRLSLRQLGWLP